MDESQIANEIKLITDYDHLDVWARQRGLTNHPLVTNRQLDLFIENHCQDNTQQPLDSFTNINQLCDCIDDNHTSENSPKVDTLPTTHKDLEIANNVGLFTNYKELERWLMQQGLCDHPVVISRHFDLLQENNSDTSCTDTGHVTGQKRKSSQTLEGEGSKSSEVKISYIYVKFRLYYIHIIYKYIIINIYYIASILYYSTDSFKTIEAGSGRSNTCTNTTGNKPRRAKGIHPFK